MKVINCILYVDDDIDDRDFFVQAINSIDISIQVVCAENGVKALSKLYNDELAPDVIFADLNMPLMNGLEFLEKVKLSEIHRMIPIIIYTGSSVPHYRVQADKLGANGYIVKPVLFAEIIIQIENALQSIN